MTAGRARLVGSTMLGCAGAATAFGALFHGWGWLAPVLLAIVVVIGVSEAVRSGPLPTALGPLLATAAVILFATAYFAGGVAIAHVLPGAAAGHRLVTLMHDGAGVIHRYAAPVPDHPGAVLLAVIGIAAVALVVDLCALTLDRAVLAAPPLLAVYIVASLLTHHGVGWRVFLMTAAGLLALLAADTAEARRRWGRRFPGSQGAQRMRSGAGRGIAATALGAAVIVPALLPGLHNLDSHGGPGGALGSGTITTVNPIVSVNAELHHNSNEVVLSYRSSHGPPGYLRLTALDRFDGEQFTAVPLRSAGSRDVTPAAPLATAAGPHDQITTIQVGPLAEHWAPAPLQPVRMSIPGHWLFDPRSGSVWSTSATTQGLRYQVESNPITPTASQLSTVGWYSYQRSAPGSLAALDVSYPGDVPGRVVDLAHRLRRATPYATALAIQNHFLNGGFSYDLNVPGSDSVNALTNFLFRTRVGYCQQYAAAMALLARIDGIPTRVAVGFTGGTESKHVWTVTGADAHTWPELRFPGFGWLAFEPTPRPDGQARQLSYATDRAASRVRDVNKIRRGNRPHPKTGKRSKLHPQAAHGPGGTHHLSRHSGSNSTGPIGLAVGLVIVLALLLPAASRFAGRRRHSHPHGSAAAAHAAWDEVRDSMVDLGLDWPEQRSPRQTVRLLIRRVPALAPVSDALQRIAVAEQQARYAPEVTVDVGPSLRGDVDSVRSALFARAGRAQRLRAAVLPRSSLRSLREQARAAGRPRLATVRRRRSAGPTGAAPRTRPGPSGPPGRTGS